MNKECRNVMNICPSGSLTPDEIVDAAHKIGALKEDREKIAHMIAGCIKCSSDPTADIVYFRKILDGCDKIIIPQAFIRCPDGVTRTYAEFEDIIKPLWKEQMRKE